MIVACLSIATMIHKGETSDESPDMRLRTSRKVSLFLSTNLGMSMQDMPGLVKQKFDSVSSPPKTEPKKEKGGKLLVSRCLSWYLGP